MKPARIHFQTRGEIKRRWIVCGEAGSVVARGRYREDAIRIATAKGYEVTDRDATDGTK